MTLVRNVLALIAVLVMVSLSSFAQEAKPQQASSVTEQTQVDPPKKVDDKEALLNLQLLATKRALAQSNYTNLLKQVQDVQNQYAQLAGELSAQVDALYKKLNLDPKKFDINFETGEVIQLAPPPPPADQKK